MSFQFSFNNLRFEDVRAQVVEFLKNNSQYSGSFDWSASNMSYIIDTMTYVTMLMSYQLTTVANNNFIDTTNIRKNAVSIAKCMGYRPKRAQSAVFNGQIKYYDPNVLFDSESTISIPANSVFTFNTGKTYINLNQINLTLSPSNQNLLIGNLSLIEGTFKEFTYLGTGKAYQSFVIPSTKVEENNLQLHVHLPTDVASVDNKWEEVKNSFTIVGNAIFFLEEDIANEGYPKVIFGDGVVGKIPTNEEIISVRYLETNGSAANGEYLIGLPSETANYILSDDLTNSSNPNFKNTFVFNTSNFIDYSNPDILSYGGKDLESLDDIKQSAPKSFAAAGRAVTRNDYITLLESYAKIFKGNAIGGDELYPDDSTQLGNIYLTGVPYFDYVNFLTSYPIYLSSTEEGTFRNEVMKYNIISTKLNFFKPSYIYVDLFPSVEFKNNMSLYEEKVIKDTITQNLSNYFEKNFTSFNALYRESKLNSEIDKIPEVISSYIDAMYYFIINSDSFYETANSLFNFIYLPVRIPDNGYDEYGNIIKYESFVQTNREYALVNNLIAASGDFNPVTTVPIENRTIYGKVYHPNVDRYMYNEDILDNDDIFYSWIKLFGQNTFFTLYRYNADLNNNIIPPNTLKSFSDGASVSTTLTVEQELPVVTDGVYSYDNYVLTIGTTQVGTVVRNYNQAFNLGPSVTSADITNTPVNGQYYEIYNTFTLTGGTFSLDLVPGDVIVFESASGAWKKTINNGDISALSDEGLFTARTQNEIYGISVSGDFDGLLTRVASAGEYIIFNLNSTNPASKWDILNYRAPLPWITLEASANIPKAASLYDVKLITNVELTTNFDGRSAFTFAEYDLIFNTGTASAESEQWVKLLNVGPSSTDIIALPAVTATMSGALEGFDYDTLVPGTIYRVVSDGIFPDSAYRIIWPSADILNQIAWENDLLIYVGKDSENIGKWRLYTDTYMNQFSIDGMISTDLPLNVKYGDYFSVSSSGNFNNTLPETFANGDKILYVGSDSWLRLPEEIITMLDASAATNLPTDALLGDVLRIVEDGDFNLSSLIYPQNQSFVQGDYIIFNGTNWIPLREYSFRYNTVISGKDFLNNLGFNSVFKYTYNPTEKYYNFFFEDIYHNVIIGKFCYDSISNSKYETGRLLFNRTVSGNYNLAVALDSISLKSVFNNYNDTHFMDKIKIQPKNKSQGALMLNDSETDFDTTFNQYIIAHQNEIIRI